MTDIGIIGSGGIAQLHANALAAEDGRVAVCCDVDRSRAEALAGRFGGDAVTDVDDLLRRDDVAGVIVAVPNCLHREMAVRALEAGKHVLLEKPMAMHVAECDEILAARKRSGRIVQMGFVTRGTATARAARDLVERGDLGRIYHARATMYRRRRVPGLGRWFTTRAMSGGGVLIDLGVHLIDLVCWVTGRRDLTQASCACHSVFGTTPSTYTFHEMWSGPPNLDGTFDVEDSATALLRTDDGLSFELHVAWAGNLPEGIYPEGVALFGDRGAVFFEPWTTRIEVGHDDGAYLHDSKPQIHAHDAWDAAWRRQARLYLDAIESGVQPHPTPEDGRAVQTVLDGLYRAAAEGGAVRL